MALANYISTQVDITDEEIAAWLSASEGQPVSVLEVRVLYHRALRKLRAEFLKRGLQASDLLPER